ncbi:MAG: SIS domain-containing protein [Acidimicrobiia bacterium]|nr:SIS domain-containing protein [Acidimicrobiia bacterium]
MHEPVLDSLGMFAHAAALPEQIATARAAALDVALPDPEGIANVVVLGTGACAVAGEVLAAVMDAHGACPVSVHQGEALPGYVGPETLVLALDPRGDTPETVMATREAVERRARVVAAGGGELGTTCREVGSPVVALSTGVPTRALLGELVTVPVVVAGRLGLVPDWREGLDESGSRLGGAIPKLRLDAPEAANPARHVAVALDRRIPFVHGSAGAAAAAAHHWKGQINENAKAQAVWNAHPEADQAELAGFGQHGDVTRQLVALVELRHDAETASTRRRFERTRRLLEECVGRVESVRSDAETPLGVFFDLAVMGDFVSLYLAALATLDPGPGETLGETG